LADKAITVISVNDCIIIKAKEKIVLQAGQSSITLDGGNITFACPGNFTVKGGKHLFDSGSSSPAAGSSLPDSRVKLFDEAFILKNEETGVAIANRPYRIKREDGTFEEGTTDENGRTHLVSSGQPEALVLELVTLPPLVPIVSGVRSSPA
jgi:type VI secretion system secreted protein VgrG